MQFFVDVDHMDTGEVQVRLDETRYQDHKWVGNVQELEGLQILPELRVIVERLLAALASKTSQVE